MISADDHCWPGPPKLALPTSGYLLGFRAGAAGAPRVLICMGGPLPEGYTALDAKREVFYLRKREMAI
jgi:hypothetical protein